MIRWLHHLFNPHCFECAEEMQCPNCEVLKQLLDNEKIEKQKLLNAIIELTKPTPIIQGEKKEIELPVRPYIPWKVKRQILEEEDRVKARIEKEHKLNEIKPMTVEELEKKLDISDAPRVTEETA